jgi:putative transcriptional regulator
MNAAAGMFIQSTDALKDPVFENTLIYIAEYNEKGATGFVVNKPFSRTLNELEEFKHSIPFPLYDGGPVDKEHLFILHMRPDLIEDVTAVADGVYYGGNFQQVVEAINNRTLTSSHIKIFNGYCGWDKGELEAEVEEGSWEVVDVGVDEVFRGW